MDVGVMIVLVTWWSLVVGVGGGVSLTLTLVLVVKVIVKVLRGCRLAFNCRLHRCYSDASS